jgi:hypothetical protein
VGIQFNNVDPVIFSSASTRKNIVLAFAKAAGVDSSKVEISSIINKNTGAKIFPVVRRRLATANVEVTSRIIVTDAAAATSLSTAISITKQDFAKTVINDLKTSEAVNFASATATVTSLSVVNPPSSSETSSGLSTGVIVVIAVGTLVAIVGFGILYVLYNRNKQIKLEMESNKDVDVAVDFVNINPMLNAVPPSSSSSSFATTGSSSSSSSFSATTEEALTPAPAPTSSRGGDKHSDAEAKKKAKIHFDDGELPPGWESEEDEETGDTFFTQPDGETTWDDPRNDWENYWIWYKNPKQTGASFAPTSISSSSSSTSHSTNPKHTSASVAPISSSSSSDDAPATSRGGGKHSDAEAKAKKKAKIDFDEGELPPGWEWEEDAESGDTFYTQPDGETTWDDPRDHWDNYWIWYKK